MKKDGISIIIVNWNGLRWLKACFDSLKKQTYQNFEIIFVEDASNNQSETLEFVKKNYPKITIVVNKKHMGFAGGNNAGYKHAKGDYILLLNNDTVHDKNYLRNLREAFDKIPRLGSVQSKLVLMNDRKNLDLCGSYWTDTSFLYYFGAFKSSTNPLYNKPMPFFTNKGASMLVKRDVIEKIGFLDDDFWTYYEETDFCHRVWLAGYECWYYPKSVCYHALGGTALTNDNAFIQFHNFKNKLMSFLKNFETINLLTIVPMYLLMGFFLCITWTLQGKFRLVIAYMKAIYWDATHIKKILAKRKKIQKTRQKTDAEIFSKVKKNPKLNYYYYLFTNLSGYVDVIK